MILRRMTENDLEQVANIESESFSMPWSMKSFKDAIGHEQNIYVVAVEKEEVLGYAGLWGSFDEADITNVCVKKEHRKKGIADMVIKYLISEGKKNEVKNFFLEVRESNVAARRLYEKNNFDIISKRKNFYERPVEDAIIMKYASE